MTVVFHRALILLVSFAAASAHAGNYYTLGEYATVGPLLTGSLSASALRLGGGLEATYGHHTGGYSDTAIGGFAQAQYVGDGAFEFGAGIQPTFAIAGLELGGAFRTASSLVPAHPRLHLAPFVSALGYGSIALRIGVPLGAGAGSGVEFGLGITIKLAWHKERDKQQWKFTASG